MEDYIRARLQSRASLQLSVPGRRLAAVLMPLYVCQGEYHVLLTQRSHTLNHHRGQIAFPGGGFEPQDPSLQHTALRESAEEIGLQPHDVDILGQLDDLLTSNSNYLVRPFVGVIPYPYTFTLDRRETAGLIEVPLACLRQQNPVAPERRHHEGKMVESFFYEYAGHIIWGATGKMLKQFLDLLDPR